MGKKSIDVQFLCGDCARYSLCEFYHCREADSYICKYFHLYIESEVKEITNEESRSNEE